MRVDARRLLSGVVIAGVAGAFLFPPAVYFLGLALAPPTPPAAHAAVPPLLADALWARGEGGRASELTPLSPFSVGQFAACMAITDFADKTVNDSQRFPKCRAHLPAIRSVEYLAGIHLRDASYAPSFRTGLSRFATTAWITRSWTKQDLIRTLAARGEFGCGFRGAEAAGRGYFNVDLARLSVPQAAMIAAFMGPGSPDPWRDEAAAAGLRLRVLQEMRDNGAIDEAALQDANAAPLGLGPAPTRGSCAR